jgi:PAT family beta-lactamase induction signal transducer AmpG
MKENFFRRLIRILGNRRMAATLVYGFSSGIPLALTGSTLQAWMTQEKVNLTTIGVFSLVGMPYTLKFLWSPFLDRYLPPVLGRRRGWILVLQFLLVAGIAWMAVTSPSMNPALMATIAVLVAFFSASQDIVVDAWRTDTLLPEEYGLGSGAYVMGYRLAMLVSGALALILADRMPWKQVYFLMALTLGVGILGTLFLAPEPEADPEARPHNMKEAIVLPLVDFFKRRGSLEVLSFIVLYKLDVVVALALTTPFLLGLGFSKTDIGAVNKGVGMVATIFGTLAGGALMTRLGMKRSLWVFGIAQGVGNLLFLVLSFTGYHYPLMVSAIATENLLSGMGTAAYSAFLMSLCNKQFSATQYALLTSLMALTRVVAGAPTGYLAERLGWPGYFLFSVSLMLPGLLLLMRFDRWVTTSTPKEQKSAG